MVSTILPFCRAKLQENTKNTYLLFNKDLVEERLERGPPAQGTTSVTLLLLMRIKEPDIK